VSARDRRVDARDARNRIARIAKLESALESAVREWEGEDWERLVVTGITLSRDEAAEWAAIVTVEVETEDCDAVDTSTGAVRVQVASSTPSGEAPHGAGGGR
jgi:hypothetical protein